MRNAIDKSVIGLTERFNLVFQNPTLRKYIFNTSWLFGEQIIRMAISLFVGIWVARILGPDQFGIFNYAQSLVGFFGAIATLGLNSIVVRELVNLQIDKNTLLGTSFFMKFSGGIILIILLLIVINIIPTDFRTKIIVVIIAFSTIFQSFNTIDFYFQSKIQSKFVVYTNFIVLLICTPIKILFLLLNASVEAFAFIMVLESIVTAAGLIYYYKNNKEDIRKWRFDVSVSKELLKNSWPLILSSIAVSIGMRIDQVMLKGFTNDATVGYYAVGVKLAEIFNFIPVVINQSLYPKIIEMNLKNDRKKLIRILRYIFYGLVTIAICVNLVSNFGVNVLFGDKYTASIGVVDILIWTVPFIYINIVTINLLQKDNKNATVLFRQLLMAVINILLNLLLIPKYGLIGASISTVVAEVFLFIFGFVIPNERWIFWLRIESLLFISCQVFRRKVYEE